MENELESGCQGKILQVPQHHWGVFFMAEIYAYERRDIMVLGVPNAFVQTNIPPKKYGEERVIMKIKGALVDIILELDSETYSKHVVSENLNKVVYVVVFRAIYGILVAALLLYKIL